MNQINTKSAIEIIKRQGTIATLSGTLPFVALNPHWAVLFGLGIILVNTWGEFGAARTKELVEELSANQKEFKREVINSDKFKSIFLSVLERHMKEASEEKRMLLRKYLINCGRNIFPTFDYHTKILTALDQITFDELKILDIWSGELQTKWIEKNSNVGYTTANVDIKMNEHGINEHQVMFVFEDKPNPPSVDDTMMLLKSLGNYGILNVRDTTGGGSSGLNVKITNFGRIFLDYIKN